MSGTQQLLSQAFGGTQTAVIATLALPDATQETATQEIVSSQSTYSLPSQSSSSPSTTQIFGIRPPKTTKPRKKIAKEVVDFI